MAGEDPRNPETTLNALQASSRSFTFAYLRSPFGSIWISDRGLLYNLYRKRKLAKLRLHNIPWMLHSAVTRAALESSTKSIESDVTIEVQYETDRSRQGYLGVLASGSNRPLTELPIFTMTGDG